MIITQCDQQNDETWKNQSFYQHSNISINLIQMNIGAKKLFFLDLFSDWQFMDMSNEPFHHRPGSHCKGFI